MTQPAAMSTRSGSDTATIVQAVTVIMGIVIGLTFLFGFGNVLTLALRLGVPAWVAPLVAPAVDLSILGLLLGTRHLAPTGASQDVLRPARRLLIFTSVVTLALNVAEPLVAGEFGKAAFDAVGPLLLIGWSHIGPGLLHAIGVHTPVVCRPQATWRSNSRLSIQTRMTVRRSFDLNSTRASRDEMASKQSFGARQRLSWVRRGEKTQPTGRRTKSRYRPTPCAPDSEWAPHGPANWSRSSDPSSRNRPPPNDPQKR